MSVTERARMRAAASSMASGKPSRRRQISVTASMLSAPIWNLARARRARSANRSMASSARESDGTAHVTSPDTPIGSRLSGQQCQTR